MKRQKNRIILVFIMLAVVVVTGCTFINISTVNVNLDRPVIKTVHEGENIKIEWQNISSADEYEVFKSRTSEGKKELIATTKDNKYLDKDIVSGQPAVYSIKARNGAKTSEMSDEVTDVLYKVVIETGHGIDENGKWDTGCTWNGDEEAKLMIPIAKAVSYYLEKNGIYVYTDAYSENDSNLNKALDFLDKGDVSVFVNIHCDYEYAESGTMPLYNNKEQKKLAKLLNKGVHEYVDIRDRGVAWRDDLETLCNKKVHCTSCLYETGCISKDNNLLKTEYKEYGKGLASGICEYLGVEFHE